MHPDKGGDPEKVSIINLEKFLFKNIS